MGLIKVLLYIVCLAAISGFSKNEEIYGNWTGKSTGENTYTLISKQPQEDLKKFIKRSYEEYKRKVELKISKGFCEISFDSYEPIKCVYESENRLIIIPLWRDEDSISDTGLVIIKLDKSTLSLENKFTRIFTDGYENRYEMKGSELYLLNKK